MFNPLNIFKAVDKAMDIASEAITDKDKLNELKHHLAEIKETTYQKELDTKTIPWVDALHKMSRPILSLLNILGGFIVVIYHPEINPMVLGGMAGPSGLYMWMKGKGR
ncbi:MAG: hypothetical protein KAS32_02165 [Candidatus Peribacteraceae bacterium]|nr:hypothetical protein [Candidatus Peribacteraceae bacterium]